MNKIFVLLAALSAACLCSAFELVHTPFGYKVKECVVRLPTGTMISAFMHEDVEHVNITYPDGSSEIRKPCQPGLDLAEQKKKLVADTPVWNGWVEHYWLTSDLSYFSNPQLNGDVEAFTATWEIPNRPANTASNPASPWNYQPTISWWIGLQGGAVLQPVLEFNGLVANQYALSSWNCCPAGYTFHSDPISNVNPGEVINGVIQQTNSNDQYIYDIITTSVNKKQSTTLRANMTGISDWAPRWAEVANEAYFITNCAQLPNNPAKFLITKLTTSKQAYNPSQIPWSNNFWECTAPQQSSCGKPICNGKTAYNGANVTISF